MISYEKNCIFVHVPKTGGTSIENVIWGRDWSKRTTRHLWMGAVRPGFNKYQTGGLQHLLATQIRQEVGEDVFNSFYKFAFVRNPWDKVISQFFYVKTRPDLLRFFGMTIETSLKGYLDRVRLTEHVQSMEQWRFVLDSNGENLVDFIGRFENLEHFDVSRSQLGDSHRSL